MKTASGLTLVALGAILAFAVTSQPAFLNLHIAGVVIMLTGAAGIIIPRRGYGWLRRRTVTRQASNGQVSRIEEQRYPPYVLINPTPPNGDYVPAVSGPRAGSAGHGTASSADAADTMVDGEPARHAGAPVPAEQTVEEFFEE